MPSSMGDPRNDMTDLASFCAQWQTTGCPIVINEVLAHSHSNAPDWVELYNAGSVPVSIGGWGISDDKKKTDKFVIPAGTVMPPFGYAVFHEDTDFGNALNPNTHTPFAISENGETLYLS